MDKSAQSGLRKRCGGFSLLEAMVATLVATVLIVGLAQALTAGSYTNFFRDDQVMCFKASHQALEELLSLDMDEMLLQDGNTFTIGSDINPLKTGTATGTITMTDLGWESLTDKAYKIVLTVDNFNVELTTVRARY